jgi:HPr Serine kinase C-terminal domain
MAHDSYHNDWLLPTPRRTLYRYNVYGIELMSELELILPHWVGNSNADVVVRLGLAEPGTFRKLRLKSVYRADEWFHHAILQDGALYIRWDDWFELLVSSNGTYVLYRTAPNVEHESVEVYLTNFAVSAALCQQGEEPLHATVVEIGGRAVGLIGPSGAGKSTLAAHLLNRGAYLVTDDMLRITFEDNAALAHLGPYRLKLLKEPAERYLQSAICCGRYNPLSGKLIFKPVAALPARGPLRLSALFQLELPSYDYETNTVSLIRLKGTQLFRTIASSATNTRIDSPARLQRHFAFTQRLATLVPVYRLTYSRNYSVLDNVADQIEEAVWH